MTNVHSKLPSMHRIHAHQYNCGVSLCSEFSFTDTPMQLGYCSFHFVNLKWACIETHCGWVDAEKQFSNWPLCPCTILENCSASPSYECPISKLCCLIRRCINCSCGYSGMYSLAIPPISYARVSFERCSSWNQASFLSLVVAILRLVPWISVHLIGRFRSRVTTITVPNIHH